MATWKHALRVAATLFVAAVLGSCGAGVRSAAAKPAQIVPLDMSQPHPIAKLSIGGSPAVSVIFDSGAGTSILEAGFAKALDLPYQGEIHVGSPGATTSMMGYITTVAAAKLGNADIANAQAVAMPLPDTMRGLSGAISPNAFAGRLVRFEFASNRAVVLDRTTASIPSGKAFAYGGEDGHPLPAADIDIAGKVLTASLDSGSHFGLNLPLELSKQLPLKTPLVSVPPVHMVGGMHAAYSAVVAGLLRVGPLSIVDPQVLFVDGVPFASVGIQILRKLTLVLDPAEQRDWLLPAG